MAPPTVITTVMLAIAFAPLVLSDTVCQPGAQLTFILQCAPSVSWLPEMCDTCRRGQPCASCFACGLRPAVCRLPKAGTEPTATTNATITNAVSGVVSANGFPSGINNIQVRQKKQICSAESRSCPVKAAAGSIVVWTRQQRHPVPSLSTALLCWSWCSTV